MRPAHRAERNEGVAAEFFGARFATALAGLLNERLGLVAEEVALRPSRSGPWAGALHFVALNGRAVPGVCPAH